MTPETTTDAPRDFATYPLTPYEQAILHLAHFDLAHHSLVAKIEAILKSRRSIGASGEQEAVLSSALDALTEEVKKPKPEWGKLEWIDSREVVGRHIKCLRQYAVECFPEDANGQIHFARAIMEGVAAELEETFGPFVS